LGDERQIYEKNPARVAHTSTVRPFMVNFEHRLALELDGGVHSQIDQMRSDAVKEDYLRTLGIRLLRIPNAMVLEHPDEFVREVVKAFRGSVEKVTK
jgi:very-short-patch-repair endonuclease